MGEFGGGLRRNGGGMAAVRGEANAGRDARGTRRRGRLRYTGFDGGGADGNGWRKPTSPRPSPPAGRAERGNGRQPAVNGGEGNVEWRMGRNAK